MQFMNRVFIYSSHSLFSQGIKNLLDAQPELDVIGWETNVDKAVKCIQEIQPDAILVVTKGTSLDLQAEEQRFLRAGRKIKILELNLEDNNMCVYCGNQLTIREISDLVKVIEEPLPTFWGGAVEPLSPERSRRNIDRDALQSSTSPKTPQSN
jgi:hypothetical protein